MSVMGRDIQFLKGVGEKRAKLFAKLDIYTVGGLLRHYPRAYEDFSKPVSIKDAQPGSICCISAIASDIRKIRIRKGMTLYKLKVADQTGECDITFFNNPYVEKLLIQGKEYVFYGKMEGRHYRKEMAAPEFEKSGAPVGLRSVYPATEGLPSRIIRSAVQQALLLADELLDPLPDPIRRQHSLCHLRYALENIHFPKTAQDLETARRRLIFEELLALELGMLSMKRRNRTLSAAVCTNRSDLHSFYGLLPFQPTNAQKRAVEEASRDMAREIPMNRLLEGDVGSGKTVVAAALCYNASRNGFQSALMAPTEILAVQHYRTLLTLLSKCGMTVGLLTGGMPAGEKQRIRKMLRAGELDVAVGTHALLQEDTGFSRLGLVITDEQHRFGVEQRAVLAQKGPNPHMLIMSATPIPRTLAMMIYGDLDISILDELPPGRQKIQTYCVDTSKRGRIYEFIKKHIKQGKQAYIVCPLVEESESSLVSAEKYAREIAARDFADFRVGLMHGKLKPGEKESIMRDFADGNLDLLVSTTVIEVGVDVPNAVIMVVENAERFGLSQLHQLRGRVGRGGTQSYCILISDAQNREAQERLATMRATSDGFKIAEKDLQLRGPGDFFGRRQHGLPELKIADIMEDMSVFKEAQETAEAILSADPLLEKKENAGLKAMTSALFSDERIIFN